jgi:YD repeat-containing protein
MTACLPLSLAVVSTFVAESPGRVFAQTAYTLNLTDGTPPIALTPGAPAGSYPLSGFESINVNNGRLNITLPLLHVAGRGEAGYTMMAAVSPRAWDVQVDVAYDAPNENGYPYQYASAPRLQDPASYMETRYGPGNVRVKRAADGLATCTVGGPPTFTQVFTYVVFNAPDGTEHALYDAGAKGVTLVPCGAPVPDLNRGLVFVARDGSGITFVGDGTDLNPYQFYDSADPAIAPGFTGAISGWLSFSNGLRYRVVDGLVRWIVDRNGNRADFTYLQAPCGQGQMCDTPLVQTITDPLKRVITVAYDSVDPEGIVSGNLDVISFDRDAGTKRYIKIQRNLDSISSIILPNRRSYAFSYNSYSEISRVSLPSGGSIEYDYEAGLSNPNSLEGLYASGQVLDNLDSTSASGYISGGNPVPPPPWRPFMYRRLVGRRVYADGGSSVLESTTTYLRAESATSIRKDPYQKVEDVVIANSGPVIVTTTGRNIAAPVVENHSFHSASSYRYGGLDETIAGPAQQIYITTRTSGLSGYPDPFEGKEYLTVNAANTVQRVWGYLGDTAQNVGVCQERVTLNDTSQSSGKISQNDVYGNPLHMYEYGYGTAPSITTQTDPIGQVYYACPVTASAGYIRHRQNIYVAGADYTGTSGSYLLHLPSSEAVYDASGTVYASTTYAYDDPNSLAPLSGATQLDSVTTKRGNATSVSRIVKDLPGGTPTTITTYSKYDSAGNVVEVKDGRNATTTYSFLDSFTTSQNLGGQMTYAFATTITLPAAETGHTAHSLTRKYDYYSGRPTELNDINGVKTVAQYDDLLDRLTAVHEGANQAAAYSNWTRFSYEDAPGSLALTTRRAQFAQDDQRLQEVVHYDGLGRKTSVSNGSSAPVTVNTVHDGQGRVFQVSNPDDGSSAQTTGTTQTDYDGAGRVVKVTRPDGKFALSVYQGNATTVTDEAGVQRKSESDALGRLTKLTEIGADNGSDAVTTYGYDVLDNLTTVTQGVQTRTFVYDSLRRLRTATNPESGQISYGYDNNGNLTSKTEQAGGYSTTLTYDAWNRLRTKTYSGTSTVPAVFCYDGYSYSGGADCTGAETLSMYGHRTAAGTATSWTVAGVGPLGRITSSAQHTKTADGVERTYSFSYGQYNDGSLASITYPSMKTVSYCYDLLGRPSWLSAARTADNCRNNTGSGALYAAVGSYFPHGAIRSLTYGNTLVESSDYNNRLQPLSLALELRVLRAPCGACSTSTAGPAQATTGMC